MSVLIFLDYKLISVGTCIPGLITTPIVAGGGLG